MTSALLDKKYILNRISMGICALGIILMFFAVFISNFSAQKEFRPHDYPSGTVNSI